MSRRMTDERLAKIEHNMIYGVSPTTEYERELLQALKAEREHIAELEETIKRLCEAADFPLYAWLEKDDE